MNSISYYSGLHLLTTDEFNNLIHKDPQGLYCIIDAPVAPHNWKHFKDGSDPLTAEDIGAIPNESPVTIKCPDDGPFVFNIDTEGSLLGDTAQAIAFYDGVTNKYEGSSSPVLLLGGDETIAKVISPAIMGTGGLRNIIVANTSPTSEVGQNGDLYIHNGSAIYTKVNGNWVMVATNVDSTKYMPISGGKFTGTVDFGVNLTCTGTSKTAGAFYGGTVNPTNSTRINYDGYLYATRVYNAYMADYAEVYSINDRYEPGMVVVIDGNSKSEVSISYMECDSCVFGVVTDNYAFCIGGEPDDTHAPIALMGKVPVLVDGNCNKGDYLITSNKRGHAKAVKELDNIPRGCVIGRALENKQGNTVLTAIIRM